jgi:hypothetical protein
MEPMTMRNNIAHEYEPLPGADFVRLMHVEPALHADAPIRFSFQIAQLEDIVAQYEAISYTWGEPKLIHPLYIDDGTSVFVAKNLDKALRRLRYPATTRVLWADAVCINQIDNEEKSKQIPLMAKIYRGAKRVLAWLDGGAEEERGMLLLNQSSRFYVPTVTVRTGDGKLKWKENDCVIHKFLSLCWFDRLWIIQEIVMNTDVVLFCGTSSITWLRFTAALDTHLYSCPSGIDSIAQTKYNALQVIIGLWKQHNTIGRPSKIHGSHNTLESILHLVGQFGAYGCADPRDRIFALYNMTQNIQPSTTPDVPNCVYMDVDYSSDIQQTYQKFASACVSATKHQAAGILHEVLFRQYDPGPDDWPSWVPDWRKPPHTSYKKDAYQISSLISLTQVDHDILALQSLGRDSLNRENFLVVDDIIMSPDTLDGTETSLVVLCRRWPEISLISILMWLVPNGLLSWQLKACADYIHRVCRAPSHGNYGKEFADISLELQVAMRHKCFFVALSPFSGLPVVGIGNMAVTKGDKVLIFTSSLSMLESVLYVPCRNYSALVLRPRATLSGINDGSDMVTYRLIGSAEMLFPHQFSYPCQPENDSSERVYLA